MRRTRLADSNVGSVNIPVKVFREEQDQSMKLVITYVVVARGATLPPQRVLDEAMLPVKNRAANETHGTYLKVRLRLIVANGPTRPLTLQANGDELLIESFVDSNEYTASRLKEEAMLLAHAATAVLDRIFSQVDGHKRRAR
jgi:hypothetical protein